MPEWLPVIINPIARRQMAILSTLNQVFLEAGVRWSMEITIAEGDARRIARQWLEVQSQKSTPPICWFTGYPMKNNPGV